MDSLNIHNTSKFSFCNCKYIGKVVNVIDGDTIIAIVQVFPNLYYQLHFRLYGINAPEISGNECTMGLDAKHFLINKITNIAVDDLKEMSYSQLCSIFNKEKSYYVYIDCVDEKDKYGRVLANIYMDSEYTCNINEYIVNGGHAEIY
jgi:endonuclease YncB( thermonuclease family)